MLGGYLATLLLLCKAPLTFPSEEEDKSSLKLCVTWDMVHTSHEALHKLKLLASSLDNNKVLSFTELNMLFIRCTIISPPQRKQRLPSKLYIVHSYHIKFFFYSF